MLDYAIIGGGVSGCYCAYRLANERPGAGIALFEASERFGGRLYSINVPGSSRPIELGGTFFTDLHENVAGLVLEELRLPVLRVGWQRGTLFLRGSHLQDRSFTKAEPTPYALTAEEMGKSPLAHAVAAVEAINPALMTMWPFVRDATTSRRKTYAALKATRHRGEELWRLGFWNVLGDVLSNEARELLISTFGSSTIFGAVNALDAVWNLMQELAPGQAAYQLAHGFQSVPEELRARCEDRVDFQSGARVVKVERADDSVRLVFAGDAPPVEARTLILALPQRALQNMQWDSALFDDADSFFRMRDDLVWGSPVSKLFLIFDSAWWKRREHKDGASSIIAAYTDLPMRQCYMQDVAAVDTSATMMAVFADGVASSFWSASRPGLELGPDAPLVMQSLAQLRKVLAQDIPNPTGAIFFDWGSDPYGGAWHGWRPGQPSWLARKAIQRPSAARNLFICGEAYSERNGWVEGAINSAEAVLTRLGLSRPSWVSPDFDFEVGDTHASGE